MGRHRFGMHSPVTAARASACVLFVAATLAVAEDVQAQAYADRADAEADLSPAKSCAAPGTPPSEDEHRRNKAPVETNGLSS
jgi:hypothetical protein